jgi:hypothetical protein
MIVELAKTVSSQDNYIAWLAYQRTVFPAPATKGKNRQTIRQLKRWMETYVSHEYIEENLVQKLSSPRVCGR